MNNLQKFIKLPFREKALFFQAIYYLVIFRIKLMHIPPKILFSKVAHVPIVSQSFCAPPIKIARIINQASRFVPYSTCLTIALAGSVLFAKNCCNADLHIGVLMDENRQLEAHAWLSYNGKIVLGNLPNLSLYKELPFKFEGDL